MGTQHLFIINPTAGKRNMTAELSRQINTLSLDTPYTVAVTKGVGDATKIARDFVANTPDFVHIYACGGDGTFNEILNGVRGLDNCAIGVIPIGSGNDFVRSFDGFSIETLLNLSVTINGTIQEIDLFECNGKVAANVISIGYDCAVAKNMVRFKRWPLVNGEMAYKISLVYCLISKMKHPFTIVADGKQAENNGKPYLLAVAGNGKFYGGGFKAAPCARFNDGYIDFVSISTVSVLTFVRLLRTFTKGEHINNPKMPFIKHMKCKWFQIFYNTPIDIGLDGEIMTVQNPKVTVLPGAQKIIMPAVPRQAPLEATAATV